MTSKGKVVTVLNKVLRHEEVLDAGYETFSAQ
jgi:hypothetical protein